MYLFLDERRNAVLYSDTLGLSHCAADKWHLCRIYHVLRWLLLSKHGVFYSIIPPVALKSCARYLLVRFHIITRYLYTKLSQLGMKYDI